MSKGIAIRTILLLVVGLIVVGVLVYLVYSYSTSGQLSVHECRVRLIELCTQCSLKNFGSFPLSSTLTSECSKYSEFSGWGSPSAVNNCNNANPNTKNLCKELGVT
jgi:hypothetical protein